MHKVIPLILVLFLCGCAKTYGGLDYSRLDKDVIKHYDKLKKKADIYMKCLTRCSTYVAGLATCSDICRDILE